MKKIEEFIIDNRNTLFVICGLILAVLFIMMGIALNLSESGKERETSGIKMSTTNSETENETTKSMETSSRQPETSTTDETTEDTESTEETTSMEEVTTEPIVVDYPYLIKVNRAANCTTVYGKDENGNYTVPIKAITVSCGKNIQDTPLGEFKTIVAYDWRLMFDNTYGHYAYRIVGSTLFHSVPYYTASNDDLEWQEYNKLGDFASLGCVRMTVADAKWLVENCPIGTTVIIYDDAANPGPLGKPETIKIPEDSPYRGWDPTDPDPNNPWHSFTASITYPSSKKVTVEAGSSIETVLARFKAKDTCGNDISSKLKIAGSYDLNSAGEYSVLVNVTDAIGRYVEIDITIVVKEKETETTTETITTTQPETSSETDTTTISKPEETSTKVEETTENIPDEEETTSEFEEKSE